jgi:hypothetical protein
MARNLIDEALKSAAPRRNKAFEGGVRRYLADVRAQQAAGTYVDPAQTPIGYALAAAGRCPNVERPAFDRGIELYLEGKRQEGARKRLMGPSASSKSALQR